MQFATTIVCAVLVATVVAHGGHDHADQIPLDYVKYPYQAIYPGDNEGIIPPQRFGLR
jgi:agmatinase